MKPGTIKHYDPDIGEGKITPTSGIDVNFEERVVTGADPATLVGGEPVQYDAVNTSEGLVATRVVVLMVGMLASAAGPRAARGRKAGPKPATKPRAKPSKARRAKPASKPRAKRAGTRGKAKKEG
jgi:cold shock CspA family protein